MLNMETLDRVSSALESGLAGNDLTEFYDVLRASELPFIAVAHNGDSCGLARACRDIVHRLGGLSPAVTLAFENHLFVTAALATFTVQDKGLNARARAILKRVGKERLFVANTSSRIHASKLNAIGALAQREGGGFRITGSAAYTSLATQSDLLLFMTRLEDGAPALFIAPLRDQAEIVIGPFLFPRAMIDSDTRRIEFRDLFLPKKSLLQGGRGKDMVLLNQFELTWHMTMVSALYLGAAARAIEEVRRFLRSVSTPEGRPLAELDGMIVDAGRLALRYRTARAVLDRAVESLGRLTQEGGVLDPERVTQAFELATAAKYVGTNYAEEIITQARKIIGARSFTGGHPLERLSMESPFGPLGPEPNAFIERLHGRAVLGEKSFSVDDAAQPSANSVPARKAPRRKGAQTTRARKT
jgi:alkylation response protein AidB-like acyl-CoA dehydrogenase